MSTKQESVSEATFKKWSFSSVFNFICENVELQQQHANTVHWLYAHQMKSFL